MRRRRLFRPSRLLGPLHDPRQQDPIEGRPRVALKRAHRLMEVGDHANAAVIFERLAREGLDLGYVRQAPFLLLQAGRSRLLAGQDQAGAALLREGLALLAAAGRWRALRTAGARLVQELRILGKTGLADEISAWLETTLPAADETAPAHAQASLRLPASCPHCGAPSRPDELEWLSQTSVACSYCGGIISTS
jgi:hypothetical protein